MTAAQLPIAAEPWQDAIDRLAGKTPVAAKLNNEQWARLPIAIRERAIWSATLAQAQVIQQIKDDLVAMKTMDAVDGRTMDRSRIVERARKALRALPGDTDDLRDLTSFRRLQLIVDFQEQDANGYARYKADLGDPDALDVEPAYRFTRIEQRNSERLDWPQRWAAAFAQVNGRGALRFHMVALKTSPIWAALSRFGRPWPPFDWGSGMGLEGVDRFEAEDLGLLSPDDTLDGQQAIDDWNAGVQASVADLDPETRSWVESVIGDIAQFTADKSVLREVPPTPVAVPSPSPARPPFVEPSADSN